MIQTWIPLSNHIQSQLALLNTDCTEIESIILNLKSDGSVSRDKISEAVLQRFKDILTEPTTYIYNIALTTGIFPDILKFG